MRMKKDGSSRIDKGCAMLGMPIEDVMAIVIKGMQAYADELGIGSRE